MASGISPTGKHPYFLQESENLQKYSRRDLEVLSDDAPEAMHQSPQEDHFSLLQSLYTIFSSPDDLSEGFRGLGLDVDQPLEEKIATLLTEKAGFYPAVSLSLAKMIVTHGTKNRIYEFIFDYIFNSLYRDFSAENLKKLPFLERIIVHEKPVKQCQHLQKISQLYVKMAASSLPGEQELASQQALFLLGRVDEIIKDHLSQEDAYWKHLESKALSEAYQRLDQLELSAKAALDMQVFDQQSIRFKGIASLYIARGDLASARQLLNRAIESAGKINIPPLKTRLLNALLEKCKQINYEEGVSQILLHL